MTTENPRACYGDSLGWHRVSTSLLWWRGPEWCKNSASLLWWLKSWNVRIHVRICIYVYTYHGGDNTK
jgi:hypothetical protein